MATKFSLSISGLYIEIGWFCAIIIKDEPKFSIYTYVMFGDQRRGDIAKNLLHVRAERTASFPSELFDEHAWNMLLHLFSALTENHTVSERELIRRSSVSVPVGQRWIRHLIKDGQIEERDDGEDVALTVSAADRMRTFLDQAHIIHGTPIAS